jgi:hypothetical protein
MIHLIEAHDHIISTILVSHAAAAARATTVATHAWYIS